ncbi:MAG TPA: neutral zinc metallopeptidase [Nocardioides sp.]|nr:neutral zinc metallopeptidase [Nocardioides sp.]
MVRFNPKARLDTSRMRDGGSSGGGGFGGGMGGAGMRLPLPTSRGGCLMYVVVIGVLLVVSMCGGPNLVGDVLGGSSSGYSTSRISDAQGAGSDRYADCKTGADANDSVDCARVAYENSITDFWSHQDIPGWKPIDALTTFTGNVSTGCGGASAETGPFYCPADHVIYEDTSFYEEVLQRQLGGPNGGFVEGYVLAHEYGHHISNLQGFMNRVKTQQGPTSGSTRLELQADCYAGLWAQHATTTEDANGDVLLQDLSDDDIKLAIEAARSVGDDRIQKKAQGKVNPDAWTHGSSAQREHWFRVGYEGGKVGSCDTFDATDDEVLGR